MAPHDPKMVAALRREREGYVRRGLDDRVAEVDEQLAYYGADPEDETPEGRTAAPDQQTADTSTPASTAAAGPDAGDTAAAADSTGDAAAAPSTAARTSRSRGGKAAGGTSAKG